VKPFDNDDYETPIEEYPGYIGYSWDRNFVPGPELIALQDFDWNTYSEWIDEAGGSRTIKVALEGEVLTLTFDRYDDIAHLLDQLPAVEVYKDDGPPDQGPAGGSGFVFVLKDDATLKELSEQITALRRSLDADFSLLSATGT
jgi:hypothetical protein